MMVVTLVPMVPVVIVVILQMVLQVVQMRVEMVMMQDAGKIARRQIISTMIMQTRLCPPENSAHSAFAHCLVPERRHGTRHGHGLVRCVVSYLPLRYRSLPPIALRQLAANDNALRIVGPILIDTG
uniref:Uncharacterized protein n=1 Tax=Anopheles farauti TaxID=69004 RepID=A0A182Q540_9DIPT